MSYNESYGILDMNRAGYFQYIREIKRNEAQFGKQM